MLGASHLPRARFLLSIALATAVNFAATAPKRPGDLTACALLSRSEVEEAASARLSEGQSRTQTGTTTTCWFNGKNSAIVALLIRRVPQGKWMSEQMERMHRSNPAFREMPGIGDRSFLHDMGKTGAALCIFRGQYYLQISVFRMGESSEVAPVLKKLAGIALARF